MTQSDAMNRDKRLYLDDLHVGLQQIKVCVAAKATSS
jgi:hypothetical protein